MAEAEIIQLGSRGKAGRGTGRRRRPAARGLGPGAEPDAAGPSVRRRSAPVEPVATEHGRP